MGEGSKELPHGERGGEVALLKKMLTTLSWFFNESHGWNPIFDGRKETQDIVIRQRWSLPGCFLPVDFPSVERLRVEYNCCRVSSLGTADAHFSSKLHPGDGENRASVGTRQGEHVLFPMFQEPQHASRGRGEKSQAHRHREGPGRVKRQR